MKNLIAIILLISGVLCVNAQSSTIDSLQKVLKESIEVTERVYTLLRISDGYFDDNRDSAMKYAQQAHNLSKQVKFSLGEVQSLAIIGNLYFVRANYVKALETQWSVFDIHKKINNETGIAACYNNMALIYQKLEDYGNAINYFSKAKYIFESGKEYGDLLTTIVNIGCNFEEENKLDSALSYLNKAYEFAIKIKDNQEVAVIKTILGKIHSKLKNNDIALSHFRSAIPFARQFNDKQRSADATYGTANIFKEIGKTDSSIFFAKQSLDSSSKGSYHEGVVKASTLLSKLYETQTKTDSAFNYLKISMDINDSLFNEAKITGVQNFTYNEGLRQREKAAKQQYLNKLSMYALIGGFAILLLAAAFLFRINQLKREHLIRTRLSKDLHDDLGSTLNSIKVYTNLALIKNEERHLQHIKESTQEAIGGVRDIIWVMDDRKNNVDDLLARLRQFAIPLCEANDIHFLQQVNDEASGYKLGQEEKKNLYLIIKEAINNTIKYARANEVDLTVSLSNKRKLSIQIKDTGQGFNLMQASEGNGLKNMKYRAEQIGYYFTINSVINQGTIIELKKH